MEPRGAPKTGRLFLKTHGDCFLHATASWLKYWNFTLEVSVNTRKAVMEVLTCFVPKGRVASPQ